MTIRIKNTDYKENKGEFDVCLFDPPFDEWKNINYIPKVYTLPYKILKKKQ